jgi:hypothetical protein
MTSSHWVKVPYLTIMLAGDTLTQIAHKHSELRLETVV